MAIISKHGIKINEEWDKRDNDFLTATGKYEEKGRGGGIQSKSSIYGF